MLDRDPFRLFPGGGRLRRRSLGLVPPQPGIRAVGQDLEVSKVPRPPEVVQVQRSLLLMLLAVGGCLPLLHQHLVLEQV